MLLKFLSCRELVVERWLSRSFATSVSSFFILYLLNLTHILLIFASVIFTQIDPPHYDTNYSNQRASRIWAFVLQAFAGIETPPL